MGPGVVGGNTQQKREQVARFLRWDNGIDEATSSRVPGVELMLIVDPHRVNRALRVGVQFAISLDVFGVRSSPRTSQHDTVSCESTS